MPSLSLEEVRAARLKLREENLSRVRAVLKHASIHTHTQDTLKKCAADVQILAKPGEASSTRQSPHQRA